jgi:hypothetical protein
MARGGMVAKIGYRTLELSCGYAEDTHIASLIITWIGKIPFKTAKEMRDKFLSDFVKVALELNKPRPSLTLEVINELKNKGYPVPPNDIPSLAQIFLDYYKGTSDNQRTLDDELKKHHWDSYAKRSGRAAVITNVDGYLHWWDNGHRQQDIPSFCAEHYRSYKITL